MPWLFYCVDREFVLAWFQAGLGFRKSLTTLPHLKIRGLLSWKAVGFADCSMPLIRSDHDVAKLLSDCDLSPLLTNVFTTTIDVIFSTAVEDFFEAEQ